MQSYLADRVDVDVVLSLLRMRHHGLNQEIPQRALDVLDLLHLVRPRGNPLPRLLPCRVELQQARLASPLDELIWLGDELGAWCKEERVGGLSLVKDALDVVAILEVDAGELRRRVVGCLLGKRSGLDDRSAGEVVVDDGLAVGLENGFCGHVGRIGVRMWWCVPWGRLQSEEKEVCEQLQ